MLYSTGGLAYGRVRSSTQINLAIRASFFNGQFVTPAGSTVGSTSELLLGWTVGGGAEWMFSSNWTPSWSTFTTTSVHQLPNRRVTLLTPRSPLLGAPPGLSRAPVSAPRETLSGLA